MSKKFPITHIRIKVSGGLVRMQGRSQTRRGRGYVADQITAAAQLLQRPDRAKTLEKMISALVNGKPVDSQ